MTRELCSQGNYATYFLQITNPGNARPFDPDELSSGSVVIDFANGGRDDRGGIGNSHHLINATCSQTPSFISRSASLPMKGSVMMRKVEWLFKQNILEVAIDINPAAFPLVNGFRIVPVEYSYGHGYISYGALPWSDVESYAPCRCSVGNCGNWFYTARSPPPRMPLPVWSTELILAIESSPTRQENILNWLACTTRGLSFPQARAETAAILREAKRRRRLEEDFISCETARLKRANTGKP
jgi:hypothetical protein